MLKPRAPFVISHWSLLAENFTTSGMEFFEAVEAALRAREVPDVTFSRVHWKEGGVGSAEREYLRIQRGRFAYDICAAPFGNGFFFSSWLARVPYGHALLWLLLIFAIFSAVATLGSMLIGVTGQLTNDPSAGCGMLFLVGAMVFLGTPLILWVLGMAIHQGHIMDEELVLCMPWIGAVYAWVFNPNAYYRIDTALMFQKTVHNAIMEVLDGFRPIFDTTES